MSKQPKWQRARVLEDSTTDNGKTVVMVRGTLLWVKTGVPVVRDRDSFRDGFVTRHAAYDTNIIDSHYSIPFIACQADKLELLARDENDFADEVALIPLEDFLAGAPERVDE